MWLVYPVEPEDIRNTRRGTIALICASAVWYLTLGIVLAVWDDDVLIKVWNKFELMPPQKTNWVPFLILLVAFVIAGALRYLGYRLVRNVAVAVGASEGLFLAQVGGTVWVGAAGTLYFGFSGLLAFVTAIGTAVELKFLRFPGQLFGMVVSPKAVDRLHWFFRVRVAWLVLVIAASLIILAAHILTDIPKNEGGPVEQSVNRVNIILRFLFSMFAGLAVATLPAITLGYWLILLKIHQCVDRLLDPNGPAVMPEPAGKEGHDLLKQVLHPPQW